MKHQESLWSGAGSCQFENLHVVRVCLIAPTRPSNLCLHAWFLSGVLDSILQENDLQLELGPPPTSSPHNFEP